ncbi:tRNA(Phe) (4-demethylwyosine(37)-C(7)) aminocarboxypropyltransferase [Dirofilaria immitis]
MSEEGLWKNVEPYSTDKTHISTFLDDFTVASRAAAAAAAAVAEIPLVKRPKRHLVEVEMKAYATILTTSAIIASIITFICLIIMLHIFIYMRWGITRQLILLNAKSRLGTRQLSEELQKKLCEEIGAIYGIIQNERQKFAQEVVNDERKMAEDVVKTENEPQYETMCGIGNEVFTTKKEKSGSKPVLVTAIENSAAENHYENIPKGNKKALVKTSTSKRPVMASTQQIEIKVPAVGGMVDETDPQYQTLVGMQNEKIFPEKKEGMMQEAREIQH